MTNVPTQPSVPMFKGSPMNFIGTYSTLPDDSDIGDVCYYNGNNYVYNVNAWVPIADLMPKWIVDDSNSKSNICSHCGAPLKPYQEKCDYCGSWR